MRVCRVLRGGVGIVLEMTARACAEYRFPFKHLSLREVQEWERLWDQSTLTRDEQMQLSLLQKRKYHLPPASPSVA
jgi:hypothetical protein